MKEASAILVGAVARYTYRELCIDAERFIKQKAGAQIVLQFFVCGLSETTFYFLKGLNPIFPPALIHTKSHAGVAKG